MSQPAAPGANSAPPPEPDPAALFQDAAQTAAYALHRPHYPRELYDAVFDAALPNRRPPFPDLTVVDIATGSGQALGPLPVDFGACVALDVSAAQLAGLPEAVPPT
ncbi:hypothetical protein TSOC_012274 [Tetrabaena socialis]|uniref:Methyltransferase domain-containing protein n=1 Tax=Tetrabaena socialis TaxID=47790 RepID=A0A2J7ZNG1_9CHLO|nr:hypothetical protein TSOC_012274 [Tetrabaena socialis]|eukprot:PNH01797.1 hypothetical protein TSOC_012274 [Tetrabaena socialis]